MQNNSDISSLSQFFNGLVSTGIGKVFVIGFGLIGLILTSRTVAPGELGTFVIMTAVVIFMTEFSSIGTNLAIPRYLAAADTPEQAQNVLSTTINFRVITILIACVVSVLLAQPLFSLMGGSITSDIILFLPLMIAQESIGKMLMAILQGQFKFRALGIANIIIAIFSLLTVIIFIFWLRMGLLGLLYSRIGTRVFAFAYAYAATRLKWTPTLDRKLLGSMLRFGFPLQINYIMSFIFQRFDIFLIGALLGPIQVAYYDIARRIPDSLSEGYESFVSVYFPFVSKYHEQGETEKLSTLLNLSIRWMLFAVLVAQAVTVVFGTEIIVLIFGETYMSSAPVLMIAMLSLAVVVVDSTLGYSLIATGGGHLIPQINLVRTLISFVAYFLLIPSFGIVGAAAAGVVSIASVNPLVIRALHRRGIRVDYGAYFKLFGLTGLLMLFVSVVGTDNLLVDIALLALYPVICVATRLIKIEEIRRFWDKFVGIVVRLRARPS